MNDAPKEDALKSRVDLIAPDFLLALGDVLAFGAGKYSAWSWARGKEWSKDYAAALRHMVAWASGDDVDPESGLPHLAHAACDLMFLIVSQRRSLGTDDRHQWPDVWPDDGIDLDVDADDHLSVFDTVHCALCGSRPIDGIAK